MHRIRRRLAVALWLTAIPLSFLIAIGSPATQAAPASPVVPGVLRATQSVTSANGRHLVAMQADGNLVQYDGSAVVWATNTFAAGSFLALQADGNAVVYDLTGRALWATMTFTGSTGQLVLQDDGNFVLYSGSRPVWDSLGYTGNRGQWLQPGQKTISSVGPGAWARSTSGGWTLTMSTTGELLLQSHPSWVAWSSFTSGANASLVVQPDGNAVVARPPGTALWSTGTAAYPGAALYLQDDGNLVLYSVDGIARWDRYGYSRVVTQDVVTGLSVPWDLGFLADGTMIFTQRAGVLRLRSAAGQLGPPITVAGVAYVGDGGLMGLAVDPSVANRVYTCQTTLTPGGSWVNEVFGWTVSGLSATRDGAPILQFPFHTIHNGCQLQFGADDHLYVGTGDSQSASGPQATDSLFGKVLRIHRDGSAGTGNPGGLLWVSKGHRNVQGLAIQPGTGAVYSVEHGTDRDDEVNLVAFGQNAGWDPRDLGNPSVYDERFPMTNYERFPNAVRPVWESGRPTIATSGGTFISGTQWRDWNGSLIVAALAGNQLRRFVVQGRSLVFQEILYGGRNAGLIRWRAPVQGPDGALYITTSMGGGSDRIVRFTRAAG